MGEPLLHSNYNFPEPHSLKLDLGCGDDKKDGFIGVDRRPFKGVDHVVDLGNDRWPFEDNSVAEARASHFLEHLTAKERTNFVNELYRVLEVGGTCEIICPHWSSSRAYGDPTHVWPPVSDFWFYYLSKEWRKLNAVHVDEETLREVSPEIFLNGARPMAFSCDFVVTWGYGYNPTLSVRSKEFVLFATEFYREAIAEIHANLKKK